MTTTTAPSRRTGWLPRAIAVGIVAGLASGLFGVGGGIVVVPGLVLLAGLDQRLAHGTSLAAIVPIAIAGAIGYATGGEVDFAVALLASAGILAGAPLGVMLLGRLPERQLQVAFAVLLLLSAARMVMDPVEGAGQEAIGVVVAAGYVLTGFASGVLAGVMGVGGGVIMVPVFTVLFGMPIILAKGTSLAVIVPGAILGTLRNRSQGTADLRLGLVVGVAGVATAALASQVSLGLSPIVARSTFAGLLVLVVARMVRRLSKPTPPSEPETT